MALQPIAVGMLPRFARPLQQVNTKDQVSLSRAYDFTSEQLYEISILTQQQQNAFGTPRSIYVDNSGNPNVIEVFCERTQFTTTLPAFGLGFFPIDALETDLISFYSLGGATKDVTITIYNYAIAPGVWYATDPLAPGFDVQAVLPTAANIQNLNEALVQNVAEDVFPASASAGYKWARNMGNDVVWWRVGGTAAASYADSFPMNPGEGFNGSDFLLPFRTAERISFLTADAAGTQIMAMDWLVD